jgi:hypothetical protein
MLPGPQVAKEADHALMVPVKLIQPVHKKADLGLGEPGIQQAQESARELGAGPLQAHGDSLLRSHSA